MKPWRSRLFIAFTTLFVTCTLAYSQTLRQPALAQGVAPTPPPQDQPALTSSMRALMEAHHPPLPLSPMAATPCVGGFAGPYPCNNVDLMAFLPLSSIGGGSNGNDIWGWTDPLDGKEYAIMGRSSGTSFVDITDPENPVYLGNLPAHNNISSLWRDIKVYANHAFIVSEASGHGMQVFDLTELRNVIVPPVAFSETAHYPGFGNAHNIVINEDSGFAYAVGTSTCSGGLHMVDIQNPTNPTNAGCFSGDGYTHDAQCVNYIGPDPDYQGQEICFNSNEDTLTIVNVTNKSNPVQISRIPYSGAGYTHQGWLTSDQTYFLLDDELDELNFGHNTRTRIWDVSNLDAPFIIDIYDGPVEAIDHNLYYHEGYVYEANYRSGLRILDAADVANGNLTEYGYFDIYPQDNNPDFDGAWSVYPYFDSGIVVVSGIESGLFILQPALTPRFDMTTSQTSLEVCSPGSDSALVTLEDRFGYTGDVTLNTANLPTGASASFDPNPVAVPGTSMLTVNVSAATPGNYPFILIGTDSILTETVDMALDVYDALPAIPSLSSPPDGSTGIPLRPTFEWNPVTQAAGYELVVASDPTFTSVVYTATVTTTTHTPAADLSPATIYYWRVRADNACGTGEYSPAFSFTTEWRFCSLPNLPIPDNQSNGVTDDLILNSTEGLSDLAVYVNASHTRVGDLRFSLEHVDTGATVVMIDRPGIPGSSLGCLGDDIDATLDDDAATPVEDECAPTIPTIQGTFLPNNPLSAFDLDSLEGAWRLQVSDHIVGATGTLNAWCLVPGDVFQMGGLQGNVTSANTGDGISVATISATDGNGVFEATSDASGDYILALPIGTFTITASASGYMPEVVAGVVVEPSVTTNQDFALTSPSLSFSPGALSESMAPNQILTRSLTISNSGTAEMAWTISESQAGVGCLPGDIPWAGLTPTSGTTSPLEASTVVVTFDSTGLTPGDYTGGLCLGSDDPLNPLATVSLTLSVALPPEMNYRSYLPQIFR